LHELRALGAGRHRDLDPRSGFTAILAVRGEHHGIAQIIVGPAQPQAVFETFDWRALSDIHVVILRRRDGLRMPAVPEQCREAQRLVALLFVDTEKPQRRCREQPVDAGLNIGAHVTRKLPRGRDQPIHWNAGKMRGQRLVGVVELLVAGDFRKRARDPLYAVVANKRDLVL
jgi:hypothetical protein